MLCFKNDYNFENRDPLKVRFLHTVLAELYLRNSVMFRNGSFFIPIHHNWMRKRSKIVGFLMILEPSRSADEDFVYSRKRQVKLSISGRALRSVHSFTDCLICDLKARSADIQYRRLIKLSTLQ